MNNDRIPQQTEESAAQKKPYIQPELANLGNLQTQTQVAPINQGSQPVP